jgi:hypothetical protein
LKPFTTQGANADPDKQGEDNMPDLDSDGEGEIDENEGDGENEGDSENETDDDISGDEDVDELEELDEDERNKMLVETADVRATLSKVCKTLRTHVT